MPSNVTEIKDYAFYNCIKLKNITLPDNLNILGAHAFENCSNIGDIEIPENISEIKEYTFCGCSGLHRVKMQSTTTAIGDYAYKGCSNLKSTIWPFDLETIGQGAFQESGLQSITLPRGVTDIGVEAFYKCKNLSYITVENGNTKFSAKDGVLFKSIINNQYRQLLYYPANKAGTTYQIEEDVHDMNKYAFVCCSNLQEITVEEGNTKFVAENGILFNESKKSIICYPGGKTETSYTIPSNVTSIGEFAFIGARNLKKIEVDSENENFSSENGILYNKDLNKIICYPAGKTDTQYRIPLKVKEIGTRVFEECPTLEKIIVHGLITKVNKLAFNVGKDKDVYYNPRSTEMNSYAKNNKDIANFIGANLKGLDISQRPTKTEYYVNEALTLEGLKVNIQYEGVNVIVTNEFTEENGFTITPPDGTRFSSTGQKPIEVKYKEAETIVNKTFYVNVTTYNPPPSEPEPEPAEEGTRENPWKIGAVNPEDVTAYVEDAILHIEGTGAMKNFESGDIPWRDKANTITEAIITNGVTNIGNYAFYECTCMNTITISESITKIGVYAFYECSSLGNITIPTNVTEIGTYAFYCCTSISNIIIPAGVTEIKDSTFEGCSGLTTVEMLGEITKIGSNAFFNCRNLTEIEIPETVTIIGENAFAYCRGLTTLIVPMGVTTVGEGAFNTTRDEEKTTIYYYKNCEAMVTYATTYPDEAHFIRISENGILLSIRADISNLAKSKYKVGETLDLTGLKIIKKYLQGKEEVEIEETNEFTEENGYRFSGSILYVPSQNSMIMILYSDEEQYAATFFDVEVIGVNSISLDTSNVKTEGYKEGDALDLTGLVVTANYTDNTTTEIVTDYTTNPQNGDILNESGDKEVTITYKANEYTNEVQESFVIHVEPLHPELTQIRVKTNPTKTKYIKGEQLDLSGLVILATYSNGLTQDVTEGYESDPAEGTILETIGRQKVTITYEGKTTQFTVIVSEEETDEDILTEESTYEINEEFIENVLLKTTIRRFLSNFNNEYTVTLSNENAEYVGTGMVVTVKKLQEVVKVLEIVIMGDVTGDGVANMLDILAINNVRLDMGTLAGAKAKAADMNNDSEINFSDILLVNNFRINVD